MLPLALLGGGLARPKWLAAPQKDSWPLPCSTTACHSWEGDLILGTQGMLPRHPSRLPARPAKFRPQLLLEPATAAVGVLLSVRELWATSPHRTKSQRYRVPVLRAQEIFVIQHLGK